MAPGDHAGRLLDPGADARGYQLRVGFNLGEENDYRVPDLGVHAGTPRGVFVPTAVAVVDVLSPADRSFQKLPFYAWHQVREVLVVDPVARTVVNRRLAGDDGAVVADGECAGISSAGLAELIGWP